MTNYNFWQSWKNKTRVEKKAIEAVKKSRQLVIKAIPKGKLYAIYIKGSFVRREMRKGSDVDFVPIVTENKYEGAIFSLNTLDVEPCCIVPLSLWEFKHNKLFAKSPCSRETRAKPDRFLKKLDKCRLIYGKALNPKKYPIRSNKKVLKDEIKIIKNAYIPLHKKGEVSFKEMAKEVFWLTEIELNLKGIKVIPSFKEILKSVKNKNHIIHEAYKFMKNKKKGKVQEKKFVLKLEKYMKNLEKKY